MKYLNTAQQLRHSIWVSHVLLFGRISWDTFRDFFCRMETSSVTDRRRQVWWTRLGSGQPLGHARHTSINSCCSHYTAFSFFTADSLALVVFIWHFSITSSPLSARNVNLIKFNVSLTVLRKNNATATKGNWRKCDLCILNTF